MRMWVCSQDFHRVVGKAGQTRPRRAGLGETVSKLLLVPGGPAPAVSQPQSSWQALFPSLGLRAPGWAAGSPLPRGWGRGEAGRVLKERCGHRAFTGAPELRELPPVPAPVAGFAAHCCTMENVVFRQPSERAGFWDHPQNVPTGLVFLRHGHQGLGVKLGLCSGWGSGLKQKVDWEPVMSPHCQRRRNEKRSPWGFTRTFQPFLIPTPKPELPPTRTLPC